MMVMHLVRNNEKGASAVVIAISMLLLMGVTALVVDVGAGFNERRQDQSAADVAALAAVQFAEPDFTCSGAANCLNSAMTNGANEAIAVANATLDNPAAADWGDAAKCPHPTDAAWVAEFTNTSPVSDCVVFNANLQKAWVRIPTIEVQTTFGRAIGFDSISSSAFAIAQADLDVIDNVIPFALPSNHGTYECLKTGPNPDWGVCKDLPNTGNFGSLDLSLFGNETFNTEEKCQPTGGTLLSNIARGVDHPLKTHPTGVEPPIGLNDSDLCPIFNSKPNEVVTQPGVGSELDLGLTANIDSVTGQQNLITVFSLDGSSYKGRLSRGGNRMLVRNPGVPLNKPPTVIDNTPLWDYLLPGQCPGTDTTTEMEACLSSWGGGLLFAEAIKDAPRFAFVPEFWAADFSNPSVPYLIKEIRPVYLNATYYNCNSGGGGGVAGVCDIIHVPDEPDTGACVAVPEAAIPGTEPHDTTCGTPGDFGDTLQAVTAFIIDRGMLPAGAQNPAPGDDNQVIYLLTR